MTKKCLIGDVKREKRKKGKREKRRTDKRKGKKENKRQQRRKDGTTVKRGLISNREDRAMGITT